jgi:phosphonopyruvate decarboxylase
MAAETTALTLDRRTAIPAVVGRHEDFLIVSGLGSASTDMAAFTHDAPHLFSMAGAMGAAAMIGLGLALAQPDRRVLVVTGEGELLMNLGALATIAVAAPGNLAILCVDNAAYGETGYQVSHTASVTDLEKVARGCGIKTTLTVSQADELRAAGAVLREHGPVFVLLRVAATPPAEGRRDMDPAACRVRFRSALRARPPRT